MKEIWYFYADWCPYCQQQNPIIDEFIEANPQINVVKILESENPDAVEHNKINGYPTFIMFSGEGGGRSVNGLHTVEQLEDAFNG